MKPKTLLVIPARGGSKGIPNKNIVLLKEKPLIFYAIDAALSARGNITKICVSTDSKEIQKCALSFGANCDFLRPLDISGDDATSADALIHATKFYEKKMKIKFDLVFLLQPTNPLVIKEDIELSLALAIENISSINSIVSVVEMPNVLKKTSFTYSESGKFIKLFPDEDNIALRRQDIDERFFKTNGSIYIVKRDFLFKNNSVYSNKILPYIMPKSRYIDIDNYEDLELANKML